MSFVDNLFLFPVHVANEHSIVNHEADPYHRRAMRRTLKQTFEELRAKKQIAMMPFIAAGYPDIETTIATIPALERAGANLIEIGFPFSDPIADGPVIQEAFVKALARKIRVADIFRAIAEVRPGVSIPLVGMLSFTVVFRYGVERFVKGRQGCGV